MKCINTYILEKLKITSKNMLNTTDTTITYLEFFNAILKWCKSNGCKNLVVSVVDSNNLPEFLLVDNFYVRNIWPDDLGDTKKLAFRIYNLKENKHNIHFIELAGNEDKLVDFITPEWIDKIMEYVKAR